jgi:hypothetical protein
VHRFAVMGRPFRRVAFTRASNGCALIDDACTHECDLWRSMRAVITRSSLDA